MKFETEKRAFVRALTAAVSVMESRNTIPILANVNLTASQDGLTIKASDLDIETTDRIAATVTNPGMTTIPGAMLLDIVRKMPDGALISVDADGKGATVKAGRSRFQLPTLPADDYPVMASSEYATEFEIGASALARLLRKSRFAMSTEETRHYLCGVYFHLAGYNLRAVATDGHRLARIDAPLPEGAEGMPGVIVPRKTVGELRKLLDDDEAQIVVSVSETKIRVATDTVSLVSKVVDGSFPNYSAVIPSETPHSFAVDAGGMKSSLDLVASVLNGRDNAIKCEVSGDMVTLSARGDGSEARDQIETGYDGPDLTFGFNGKYIVEMMDVVSDLATFSVDGKGGPIVIKDSDDPGALLLCMPMRVN